MGLQGQTANGRAARVRVAGVDQGWGVSASLIGLLGLMILVAGYVTASAAQPAGEVHSIPQIKLTESQVKGFIASQKELLSLAGEVEKVDKKSDQKFKGKLDALAVKHGFKDFIELDVVAQNVAIVMAGLNPRTGEFVDLVDSLKEELAEVKADKSLKSGERVQLVRELEESIASTDPLRYKGNVALVKKFAKQIDAALD